MSSWYLFPSHPVALSQGIWMTGAPNSAPNVSVQIWHFARDGGAFSPCFVSALTRRHSDNGSNEGGLALLVTWEIPGI